MEEERLKEIVAGLEEARKRYLPFVSGEPLSYYDVMFRFIVYASTLDQIFHYSPDEFAALIAFAKAADLTAGTVPALGSQRRDN